MADLDLTYKIIILDILSKSDIPLKASQIADFFLDNDITDYFGVQDAIGSLSETANISAEIMANSTFYRINEKGAETLSLFSEKITDAIKEDIDTFFASHALAMRQENAVRGTYYPTDGGYFCHLKRTEEGHTVFDLTFRVHDRALAETICANWEAKADAVYDTLMDLLV